MSGPEYKTSREEINFIALWIGIVIKIKGNDFAIATTNIKVSHTACKYII